MQHIITNNNIANFDNYVNDIFECGQLDVSIKSKVDAEALLCEHLFEAFRILGAKTFE